MMTPEEFRMWDLGRFSNQPYTHTVTVENIEKHLAKQNVFSGRKLFELKATHGMPLDTALSEIMVVRGYRVSWVDFIEAARENKRWDYQTVAELETALPDSGIHRDAVAEILARVKLYMLKNPHPGV